MTNLPEQKYHVPVLKEETINLLMNGQDGVYVDATFGGGGHVRELLGRMSPQGIVYGFDQDQNAVSNVPNDHRFKLVMMNFRYLQKGLRIHGVKEVDGIMADLGVSSHQFDNFERGFSYRGNALLDMRMNQLDIVTAQKILREYKEDELLNIFSLFGQIRNSRQLARQIAGSREKRQIVTTTDLLNVINPVIIGDKFRYMAQVFQSLRMEVNDEMGALAELLEQGQKILRPGGKMVILTYHSVEDKMVKNFFKTGNIKGEEERDFYGNINRPFTILTKKPIEPSLNERKSNPRSQSAKLRAAIKV